MYKKTPIWAVFVILGIFSDLITSVDFWAIMGNNPKEFRQI